MDGIGVEIIRPPGTQRGNRCRVDILVLIREAQGRGGVAGGTALFRDIEDPPGGGVIRSEGFVHIAPLARTQRDLAEFLVHLAVVGGKDDDRVALRGEFLDGRNPFDAVFGAPFIGGHAADGAVDMAVSVRDLHLAARYLFDERGIIVGVPFIEIIIYESDFHNGLSSPISP